MNATPHSAVRRRVRNPADTGPARQTGQIRPAIPPEIESLFQDPPLIPGEDPAAYAEMLARISRAVQPRDVIERFWVDDIAYLAWECLRLRRMKASILKQARTQAVTEIALAAVDPASLDDFGRETMTVLTAHWVAGSGEGVEVINSILSERRISTADIMAQAMAANLAPIERFESMIASAEARRNATLREIGRWRESFARRLRTASGDTVDVPTSS